MVVTKLSGTGNTFLFIDARTREQNDTIVAFFNTKSRSQIAKILCDPHHSIGADGLVFVENPVEKVNNSSLKWDFYNADGSSAEMCGNASRCFALYAKKIGINDNPLRFESRAGVVDVSTLDNGEFDVLMPQMTQQLSQLKVKKKIGKTAYLFLNTGVPHAVIETKFSLLQLNEKQLAQLTELNHIFKKHSRFKPGSTNVTFYYVKQAGKLESLTFERGVRGFTQACGTGAVAAAAVYKNTKKFTGQSVRLNLPGGNVSVILSDDRRPHLIGPAKVIAEITLEH